MLSSLCHYAQRVEQLQRRICRSSLGDFKELCRNMENTNPLDETVDGAERTQSDVDSDSDLESFPSSDEEDYQQGLDPVEDHQPEPAARTSSVRQILSTSSSAPFSQKAAGTSSARKRRRSRSPARPSPQKNGPVRPSPQKNGPVRPSPQKNGPVRPSTQKNGPDRWKTQHDPDTVPQPRRFVPKRDPGPQLDMTKDYTPLELFSLFIDRSAIKTLCSNINKCAAKNITKGKKYSWTELTENEFHTFLGLVFYFCCVGLHQITKHWRQNTVFSQVLPSKMMSRDRYRSISWNIHMSNPEEDVENDRKKGTPEHDRLFRLRPLMDTLITACKAHYHPKQNLSIDERMVASKANTGFKQYMLNKPTKWGFKLFVLADSDNGYTVDFKIYTGKSKFASGNGLSYDSVMSLINPSYLGGGYNLYVDNFYTSPKLFRDLLKVNIGACGTYRQRQGCPRTEVNALTPKDPRGTIRWIRDDGIVFVKWMDSREVSVCSTIHPAYTGDTISRKIKADDGTWGAQSIPCPNPIVNYNKHMGGVDLSDQLIQYYSAHRKTMHWYRTLFYHFLDIAATNAYLLHKEMCFKKGQRSMTHLEFIENLTVQLCKVTIKVPPPKAPGDHLPVTISVTDDPSKKATIGRRICVHCRQTDGRKMSTPWKCSACDVALCVIPDRNCFFIYHQ